MSEEETPTPSAEPPFPQVPRPPAMTLDPEAEVEWAFVVQLDAKTNEISFITSIGGFPMRRQADTNDVFRASAEIQSRLQSLRNALEVVNTQMRHLQALSRRGQGVVGAPVDPSVLAALAARNRNG